MLCEEFNESDDTKSTLEWIHVLEEFSFWYFPNRNAINDRITIIVLALGQCFVLDQPALTAFFYQFHFCFVKYPVDWCALPGDQRSLVELLDDPKV